jgi:hypothetical protein
MIGATVFGEMWKDPNDPKWEKDIAFPPGTAVFKLLFTNATNDELPNMVGSPTWKAVCHPLPLIIKSSEIISLFFP